MFSRYKKNSASGAQPVKAPVPAAPVATQPAAQPSAVRRKAKPAAQAGPVDKEKKRKERLGEIKLELHRALLENLNLAALDKASEGELREEYFASGRYHDAYRMAVLQREHLGRAVDGPR